MSTSGLPPTAEPGDTRPRTRSHLAYPEDSAAPRLSESGIELLLKALESLMISDDTNDILELIPSLFIPHIASLAILARISPDRRSVLVDIAEDGPEHAPGHVRPAQRSLSLDLDSIHGSILHSVITGTLGATLTSPLDLDLLSARYGAATAQEVRQRGCTSAVTAPIGHAGSIDAVLVLFTGPHQEPFHTHDLSLVAGLTGRLGRLLERVDAMTVGGHLAAAVKHTVVRLPEPIDGLEFAVAYLPATRTQGMSGDWYDIYRLPNGSTAVSIGDVMGHGADAAAYMSQITAALRAYSWLCEGPGPTHDRTDLLVRGIDPGLVATTSFFAEFAPLPGGGVHATASRAGHPPPIIRWPDGLAELVFGRGSTPLGIPNPEGPRPTGSMTLPSGSVVILYTDGLLERRGLRLQDQFESLRAFVEDLPLTLSVEQIRTQILTRFAAAPLPDDACVLVIRVL